MWPDTGLHAATWGDAGLHASIWTTTGFAPEVTLEEADGPVPLALRFPNGGSERPGVSGARAQAVRLSLPPRGRAAG
ncbi:hypothetical protein chiPu_0012064 [Chiloscyllium punctatum]|uniref:Uncharacterized protein n=1 Tax=Chiloscyllium punctatum TaxID=137246 RepID=A0A401ST55_CHIPU|nr:hypothetical protein [Chiloscyllium punctatum]